MEEFYDPGSPPIFSSSNRPAIGICGEPCFYQGIQHYVSDKKLQLGNAGDERTEQLSNFSDYTLQLPILSNKTSTNDSDELTGADKQIVMNQVKAAEMLKLIGNSLGSPERVAWLSLWAKSYTLLEGSLGALCQKSAYTLRMIERAALEAWLHACLILDPLVVAGQSETAGKREAVHNTKSKARLDVVERLRAYTAWGLYNDKQVLLESLNRGTMDGLWDHKWVTSLKSEPKALADHEAMFGALHDFSTEDILESRKSHERSVQATLKQIDGWLNDPSLTSWRARLENNPDRKKGVTFLRLLDPSKGTLRSGLRGMGVEFLNAYYKRSSLIVHGSSICELLSVESGTIAPIVNGTNDDCEDVALAIVVSCEGVNNILSAIQSIAWTIVR